MYDDIVFDSSAISSIHPRLHRVNVNKIEDIAQELDLESVKIDGEYFLAKDELPD